MPAPAVRQPGAAPLAAKGLGVAYDGKTVLSGIDLAIRPGCLTVIAGPNGSGKSTLLMALGRVLTPSAGEVLLHGQPIRSLPDRAVARQLAILPQSPARPEGLSVFELVGRGRYPHQGLLGLWSEADQQAVAAALAATGMTELSARSLGALSGGQCQRAWIAMALAQEAPVILLDEPTSALDLRYQLEVMAMLRALARQGRSIVAVIHDLNLAAAYADRIVLLREGRLIAEGGIEEICVPEQIEACFGIRTLVMRHPHSGRPVILPEAE